MIFDPDGHLIVGNEGWVDEGALWTFDLRTRTESRIAVAGSKYLSLRKGEHGLFRLVHHHSTDQRISIRRIVEPDIELASISLQNGKALFLGNSDLWKFVEPSAICNSSSGQRLILIDGNHQKISDLDLTWYNSENYDLLYQGLTDSLSIKSIERVIVSVQRSSKLVIIDTEGNSQIDSAQLMDRGGNPTLLMRTSTDFLASDYDTLCRVDCRSFTVLKSARLQGAAQKNSHQFIGEFDVGNEAIAVSRPFSSDVILVDPENFDTIGRVEIGGQPLLVCLISNSEVVTRDWKTGRVSIGEFRK